jgi:hypothetical protein
VADLGGNSLAHRAHRGQAWPAGVAVARGIDEMRAQNPIADA